MREVISVSLDSELVEKMRTKLGKTRIPISAQIEMKMKGLEE